MMFPKIVITFLILMLTHHSSFAGGGKNRTSRFSYDSVDAQQTHTSIHCTKQSSSSRNTTTYVSERTGVTYSQSGWLTWVSPSRFFLEVEGQTEEFVVIQDYRSRQISEKYIKTQKKEQLLDISYLIEKQKKNGSQFITIHYEKVEFNQTTSEPTKIILKEQTPSVAPASYHNPLRNLLSWKSLEHAQTNSRIVNKNAHHLVDEDQWKISKNSSRKYSAESHILTIDTQDNGHGRVTILHQGRKWIVDCRNSDFIEFAMKALIANVPVTLDFYQITTRHGISFTAYSIGLARAERELLFAQSCNFSSVHEGAVYLPISTTSHEILQNYTDQGTCWAQKNDAHVFLSLSPQFNQQSSEVLEECTSLEGHCEALGYFDPAEECKRINLTSVSDEDMPAVLERIEDSHGFNFSQFFRAALQKDKHITRQVLEEIQMLLYLAKVFVSLEKLEHIMQLFLKQKVDVIDATHLKNPTKRPQKPAKSNPQKSAKGKTQPSAKNSAIDRIKHRRLIALHKDPNQAVDAFSLQ